jgi:membrane associated rhomboid family serine protease
MFFKLSPALKMLIIINVVVYFANNLLFGAITIAGAPLKFWIMKYFALIPIGGYMTPSGIEFEFYPWQLITYQFMHGGFPHILFNMFGLWMFSSELEETWGSAKYLVFYLLCGIGAGLLHMLISLFMGSIAPTIGASGSLYGVIIGFAMLNPDRKIMMFPLFIPIPARIFGIGMMVLSIIMGVTSADGVAHFAHFGGALTGLILLKIGEKTPLFRISRKYINFGIPSNENTGDRQRNRRKIDFDRSQNYRVEWTQPSQTQQQTKNEETNNPKRVKLNNLEVAGVKITQEMIDAILDKISTNGYHSLTEQEKYILTEISKLL